MKDGYKLGNLGDDRFIWTWVKLNLSWLSVDLCVCELSLATFFWSHCATGGDKTDSGLSDTQQHHANQIILTGRGNRGWETGSNGLHYTREKLMCGGLWNGLSSTGLQICLLHWRTSVLNFFFHLGTTAHDLDALGNFHCVFSCWMIHRKVASFFVSACRH